MVRCFHAAMTAGSPFSPNCSMAKARHTLDFRPRYSSLEAVQESVGWLIDKGKIKG